MPKFKKNQIVYQVSTRFSSIQLKSREGKEIRVSVVVERKVDSCGEKQMTFYSRDLNNSNDFVFGKKAYAPFNNCFANAEDALNYALTVANSTDSVVIAEIYADDTDAVFNNFRENKWTCYKN